MAENNEHRDAYVERATKLKQRDKIKIFNLLVDAYANHLDLDKTMSEALKWSGILCDMLK